MGPGDFVLFQWLVLLERELLIFAGVFFLAGALDEFAVDLAWIWLRLTGRARTRIHAPCATGVPAHRRLPGRAAVFIPAWREDAVIGATVRHMLDVWSDPDLRIYVGCYRNDPATVAAAAVAASGQSRVRIVIHESRGPTTKADCLNRLYRALEEDEARSGERAAMVLLHDAEDMADPAALDLMRETMHDADLVQLPVLPLPQRESRWVGSHYCEEFVEAHGKALVVRDALRAGIPLAGVGCAISRDALTLLAAQRRATAPFAAESLTEDYEIGLGVAAMGGRTRFVRRRTSDGRLIATRAYFPPVLSQAVRQKTRWVFGIAFQGWDRLGWKGAPAEVWMRLRDRRGPFNALLLAIAYGVLIMAGAGSLAELLGFGARPRLSPLLSALLWANFAFLGWRCAFRFGFTAREFGAAEGVRAVLRLPLANIVAIMAARRALLAYIRSLGGAVPRWDKTEHRLHPAIATERGAA
ncbi:glycosyl transferase family protein [Pelagerythrobacter marensis]|uniref:Putative bacteriophage N4 adsorption protein B n=1 Tax=Pelagerythrobacter marensis TaxID=543877 RepID=A0A0G3X7Q2_9SPHN|nr:glycosyl transferase family protein [Pelagerythrobacter marensis]AKM06433.1 Putative bacteriophage N4 adsorption protein B [Pelagerythrobacter marensis]